jgi:3-hydroxy-9,10-secoandrosta-1,3,5(10)-triene-9,17-dione monooxygenase reductase component
MTVNSLISVSLDPLLLLFCARIRSATAATISRNGAFSVNILSDKQIDASVHFAGKRGHFDEHSLQCRGEHIWMSDTEGSILCSVERIDRAGDHDIIIGRVEHIVACSASRSPLIYHEGQYYSLGDAHAMPQAPRAPALCPIAASVEEGHP